jgi:hypothetical protein
MPAVTYTQVQELVARLPVDRLPAAYDLLRELIAEQSQPELSQEVFMRLPLAERQHQLAHQAAEILAHYEYAAEERELWQGGDVSEY